MKKVILCYHGIGEDHLDCNVSWKLFQSQISSIVKGNYYITSVEQVIDSYNCLNSVAITFDDGLESSLSAVQWLLEKNISVLWSILAIPNSPLHQDLTGRTVSLQIIARLLKTYPRLEIASHGLTHRNLTTMSFKEAASEVLESRDRLQNELQVPVRYFVYPFGHVNREIAYLVKSAGYEAAFTTVALPINSRSNQYNFSRLCINEKFYPENRLSNLMSWSGGSYLYLAYQYRKLFPKLL
jgi:poly-beta-1,6-N-acetyl-D-glucosamine N-deacetylase